MLALRLVRVSRTSGLSRPSLNVLCQKKHVFQPQNRCYAKKREQEQDDFHHLKAKKGKHKPDEIIVDKNNITDPSLRFVPGSSMPHGADYDKEEKHADQKMNASIRWFKEQAKHVEVRCSGRVVPDVLDGVKVSVPVDPENKSEGNVEVGLKDIATVGVKNGNVLVVTVFDEHTLRAVEKALYDSQLPGLTPQRTDARTILLPVPQPTVESKNALLQALQKQAEEAKVAMRKVHQASQKKIKALGFDHKSTAMTDFTALVNKRIAEVDDAVKHTKKVVAS